MKIIVTGGNSGIGKVTSAALAAAGHSVLLACRNLEKADQAAAEMRGDVDVRHLDLADLASVREFAGSVDSVDVLVNNAGVLGLPLTRTVDGFEAHMGTNYLGHFALTCLLGETITDRVICVVSAMYALSRLHLDDLNWHARKYSTWQSYSESKLALMLFTHELAARGIRAYACDPGATDTDITRHGGPWLQRARQIKAIRSIAQSPSTAARSSIQAVTTDLPSGTCLAPRFNQWGTPRVTVPRKKARDPEMARRLWDLSVQLTGCDWATSRQHDA